MSWREEMERDLIEFFELDLEPEAFDLSFEQSTDTYTIGYCNCCDGSVVVETSLVASYTIPIRKHRSKSLSDTTWEDFFRWVDNGKPER